MAIVQLEKMTLYGADSQKYLVIRQLQELGCAHLIDLAPSFLQAAGEAIPEGMSGRSLLSILRSKKSGLVDASRTLGNEDRLDRLTEWYTNSDKQAGKQSQVGIIKFGSDGERTGALVNRQVSVIEVSVKWKSIIEVTADIPDDEWIRCSHQGSAPRAFCIEPESHTPAPAVRLPTTGAMPRAFMAAVKVSPSE